MIFRTKWLPVLVVCLVMMPALPSIAQEARVNQKKIDRERAKKEKQAVREYEQAVKKHYNRQSKATKQSMKRTKRESKSATPVKH